jgi:TonB family protein
MFHLPFSPRRGAFWHCATLLALATGSAVAQVPRHVPIEKQEVMLFADDPVNWSSPRIVVPPTYPKALADKGVTGYVDVEAKLNTHGVVDEVTAMRSVPPAPEFEAAVREVISLWNFYAKISPECAPVESVANTRVWFEIKEGKESISVSNAGRPVVRDSAAMLGLPVRNFSEVLKAVRDQFPRDARRYGQEGVTYAVMTVNGDTGETLGVEVPHVSSHKDYVAKFRRATIEGLKWAVLAVRDEHKGRTLKVCKVVSYRLSN